MPTPIFILIIVLMLWIVFRDDIRPKHKFKPYRKTKRVKDECEFYEELMKAEKTQCFELN